MAECVREKFDVVDSLWMLEHRPRSNLTITQKKAPYTPLKILYNVS